MSVKRTVALIVITLCLVWAGAGLSRNLEAGKPQPVQAAPAAWTFQGRVYEGDVGKDPPDSKPLDNVIVSVYGANSPYPNPGTLLGQTKTNAEGWYGITVPDGYEFYYIRETDPAGYISAGARSVDGAVKTANWIEYAYPLAGKTFTGNKFWDVPGNPTPTNTPTPTPTLHPTPTPTPTPTQPTLDLQVEHVELIQAIQCKDNSNCPDNAVPLIAGKTTYARVYIKVQGSTASVGNVSANLTVKFPGGSTSIGWPMNTSITAKTNPQRSQFNDTLNFWLDPWVVKKSGTVEVEVNPKHTVIETDYSNNKTTVNMNFVTTPPLDVVPVRVHYQHGTTSAVVDANMFYALNNYLENIYPVPDVKWHILPGPPLAWTQPLTNQSNWGNVLAYLNVLKAMNNIFIIYGQSTTPVTAHWYGLLPFQEVSGIAGLAASPGYVAMGRVAKTHQDLEDGADIMAHELGHNLSRGHAPCGVPDPDLSYPYTNARLGDYGWDPQGAAGGRVQSLPSGYVVPDQSFDNMSYCQDEWISEYTYRALLNYRGSSPTTGMLRTLSKPSNIKEIQGNAAEQLQPYLITGGMLDGDQLRLDPWIIMEAPIGFYDEPGDGSYHLRLVAPNDEPLFVRNFEMETFQETPLPGEPAAVTQETVLSFSQIVPWHPDTDRIQIWQGDTLLAERITSGNPPSVELLSPHSGDSWTCDGVYVVEWAGEDGDQDPLYYTLVFSRDGGGSWEIIAANLEETFLEVRGDQFPGTQEAMIRVYASDGILTTASTSGLFGIETKPPQALITLPMDNTILPPGTALLLTGYAYDWEDGNLEGDAISWHSSADGHLGFGNQIMTELTPGVHTLTIHATDSDENIGTASVQVSVGGGQVYLPLVLWQP